METRGDQNDPVKVVDTVVANLRLDNFKKRLRTFPQTDNKL